MAKTEAQARASAKYRADKQKHFLLTFYPKDEALWQHLQAQPKKAEYLRRLIREDMEKGPK